MNNKIAFISDLHLGRYYKTNIIKYNKILEAFNLSINKIKSLNIGHIINCGDTIHTQNLTSQLALIMKELLYTNFNSFKVDTIRGNHETIYTEDENKSGTILELLLPSPAMMLNDIWTEKYGNYTFHFIPWSNKETLELKLKSIPNMAKNNNIIVSHFTPKEVFSYGSLSIKDNILNFYPDNKISNIFLGDYHDPLDIDVDGTKVCSVGSTYPQTVSEIKSLKNKRIVLFDIVTGETSYIPYDFGIPEIKIINNISEFEDFIKTADKTKAYHIQSEISLDGIYSGTELDLTLECVSSTTNSVMEDLKTVNITSLSYEELFSMYISGSSLSEIDKNLLSKIYSIKDEISENKLISILKGVDN